MLKSTGCSSRGPEFNSQHSHNGSQPSVILIPGYLMPSSGLHRHCTDVVQIHAGKTPKHLHFLYLTSLHYLSFIFSKGASCPEPWLQAFDLPWRGFLVLKSPDTEPQWLTGYRFCLPKFKFKNTSLGINFMKHRIHSMY